VAASLVLLAMLLAAAGTAYRQRAQFRQAADLRDVVMDTNPTGAEVVYVPLDPRTGLPAPDRLIAAGLSPISMSLPPGDYLVVAAHADGKFHEVLRHVPRSDEGLAGGIDNYFYFAEADGTIRLPPIKLWKNSEIRGMTKLESPPGQDGRARSLFVDRREMLTNDLEPDFVKYHQLAPDQTYISDYYLSAYCAEHVGKRVPTAPEFRWILSRCGFDGAHGVTGLFSQPWEWTSTWDAMTAQTAEFQNDPSLAALVNDASPISDTMMQFGGAPDGQGRVVNRVNDADAAIRPVRSVRPRLQIEDYWSAAH
jgi:hypothetical protein